MKYILVDKVRGEYYNEEFETAEDAIESAEIAWEMFTEYHRNLREEFLVLESVNPDENAENHLGGNIVKRWK